MILRVVEYNPDVKAYLCFNGDNEAYYVNFHDWSSDLPKDLRGRFVETDELVPHVYIGKNAHIVNCRQIGTGKIEKL